MIELGAQCVPGEHYFPAARDQAETLVRVGAFKGLAGHTGVKEE
jgi:hypothetical protein